MVTTPATLDPTTHPEEQDARARWAAAGLDQLTGAADGPGLGPPPGLVDRLDATTRRIRRASDALGHGVTVDGLAELAARAAPLGLRRRGRVSCGGACHLVRASDGWFAVSLCRPEDWELLPAWLGSSGHGPDRWDEVHARSRTMDRDELVARGALLGLPIGALADAHRVRTPRAATPPAGSAGRDVTDRPDRARSIRVADLSSMWAGPLCGAVLADAGAHVLKVESTTRPDGMRRGPAAVYDRLNHRKEHVVVDLTTPRGVGRLEDLLRSVDVVIESSRPRALEQLGIDARQLLADPDGPEVWVSITGHGREGDSAGRVAFGDDAAVAGGLVAWFEGEPVFCADAIADPLTGLAAAASTLEALLGLGSGREHGPVLIEVAMSQVAAHFAGSTDADGCTLTR